MPRKVFPFLILLVCLGAFGRAADSAPKPNPSVSCTYECAGLYWRTSESGVCRVRYTEDGKTSWRNGMDLVYDSRNGEYRGSLVGLRPATRYRAELVAGAAKAEIAFTTRSDVFPVGRRTLLPAGESTQTVVITESGTPDAYHWVTVPDGGRSTIDLRNSRNEGIVIDADYVVVDGVEIRNAAQNAILIKGKRHDVVVQNTHLTFWGRIGGPKSFGNFEGNLDAGVYAEPGTARLTIQRNLIENPRGASNDWETGHPTGPEGITIMQSQGGNVLRYNDILSTEDHGFNDGIGGATNFSAVGNINCDSDIYGNHIRSVWDDAIECEGANANVRIWGNYLERYHVGIATACTHVGPIYLYRNVFGVSRRSHLDALGSLLFKTGNNRGFGGGRRLIFHNTSVQPAGVFSAIGRDANCVTRNNVFDVPGGLAPVSEQDGKSDFDHDYFSGILAPPGAEPHRINQQQRNHRGRLFERSQRLEFYPAPWVSEVEGGKFIEEFGDRKLMVTDPLRQVRNPLIDSGVRLPGFNDDFVGAAPDVGAFEVGRPPLEFGRRAYLGRDEGRAPWESYQ